MYTFLRATGGISFLVLSYSDPEMTLPTVDGQNPALPIIRNIP